MTPVDKIIEVVSDLTLLSSRTSSLDGELANLGRRLYDALADLQREHTNEVHRITLELERCKKDLLNVANTTR